MNKNSVKPLFGYLIALVGLLILAADIIILKTEFLSFISAGLFLIGLILSYRTYLKSEKETIRLKNTIDRLINEELFQTEKSKEEKEWLLLIKDKFTLLKSFVTSILSTENQDSSLQVTEEMKRTNNDNLLGELIKMQEQMHQISLEENQRNWIAKGEAIFSEIFRNQSKTTVEILEEFIIKFTKYVKANQASIFIAEKDADDQTVLSLKACYAYDRKKYLTKSLDPGEGLIGQAYLEKSSIYLKEVPENYISIRSGLGDAPPDIIYITPLKLNESVVGIIELASFTNWKKFELDFIDKVAEIVGSAISTIQINEHTKQLLEESQSKEEQLKSQEEELRQNLEELNATQEAMERKNKESSDQNIKLNAILDSAVDPIITIDTKGTILSVNKATLELFGYQQEELINSNVKMLMPDPPRNDHDGYLSRYHNTRQKHIIGDLRKVDALKKDGSIFPAEIAVNEAQLEGGSIYTGIIRDITERISLENEQTQFVEELRAQEEELRQNMEELHAQQEEIERQLKETDKVNREMDARIHVLNESTILSEANLYGDITFVNDKFCDVSQYTSEELIGNPHKMVRHPDMPKEVFALMWKTIKKGEVFRGYVKNRKKDGSPYYVDALISPVLDEDGQPTKYIGARYVIEDEVLAEKLLKEQAEKLNITI